MSFDILCACVCWFSCSAAATDLALGCVLFVMILMQPFFQSSIKVTVNKSENPSYLILNSQSLDLSSSLPNTSITVPLYHFSFPFFKGARVQIYLLVVSRAFMFTNNFWTCALGLLLRPACVFYMLQQRKSSCRFLKLVRYGRIQQFQ